MISKVQNVGHYFNWAMGKVLFAPCTCTTYLNEYTHGLRLPWWRHQMETFSALLAISAGNSPVSGEFPAQRPVTWSFDVFFDLRPYKRLTKHWRSWWFETPSWSLWRQCNVVFICGLVPVVFYNTFQDCSTVTGTIHYHDVIMGPIASQITTLTIVYSTVYSDADQRKYQSSASLVFVLEIHRGPVNFPHKWPVTRKMLPFDDVIMHKTAPVPVKLLRISHRTPNRSHKLLSSRLLEPHCFCTRVDAVFNWDHDDVIKWKKIATLPSLSAGIPRTKASDTELWCFLWSASE